MGTQIQNQSNLCLAMGLGKNVSQSSIHIFTTKKSMRIEKDIIFKYSVGGGPTRFYPLD